MLLARCFGARWHADLTVTDRSCAKCPGAPCSPMDPLDPPFCHCRHRTRMDPAHVRTRSTHAGHARCQASGVRCTARARVHAAQDPPTTACWLHAACCVPDAKCRTRHAAIDVLSARVTARTDGACLVTSARADGAWLTPLTLTRRDLGCPGQQPGDQIPRRDGRSAALPRSGLQREFALFCRGDTPGSIAGDGCRRRPASG